MKTRAAAVAGSFYAADRQQLRHDIDHYLADVDVTAAPRPKALIVPHAGYIYSGPIAATAYHSLQANAEQIHRVVLLGPSHHVGFKGVAIPNYDNFSTPLGNIPLDQLALSQLRQCPAVQERNDAHLWEHSLEVQLPFLQVLLSDFSLIPLVIGDASSSQVAELLALLWGGPETLIVVSSDLSHYHDYQSARQQDLRTRQAIEDFHTDLDGNMACGCRAINGLLELAATKHMQLNCIDLRNSGDTAGRKDRVVGYGAFLLH